MEGVDKPPFCFCGCGQRIGSNNPHSRWKISRTIFKSGHGAHKYGIPWTDAEKKNAKEKIYTKKIVDGQKKLIVNVEISREIIEEKKKQINYKYENKYLETKLENGKRKRITTPVCEIIAAHSKILENKNPNKCWACQLKPFEEKAHIVADSDGGDLSPENLVLLCSSCHSLQHFWSYSKTWNIEKQYDWFKWMWNCPSSVKISTFF